MAERGDKEVQEVSLYTLYGAKWHHTQMIYHALAYKGEKALVISSSSKPYVCSGFSQHIDDVFNIRKCIKEGVSFFRRETGGGPVYLDENQVFYNIIFDGGTYLGHKKYFSNFLKPVIRTLRYYDIKAEHIPLADICVRGKKISGNGGGNIGEMAVIVGNILLKFNAENFTTLLNVPENAVRDLTSVVGKWMTSVERETGIDIQPEEIGKVLIEEFQRFFGNLVEKKITSEMMFLMESLIPKYISESWLYSKKMGYLKKIKVKEGVDVIICDGEVKEIISRDASRDAIPS